LSRKIKIKYIDRIKYQWKSMSPSNSKEKTHVDVVPEEFDIRQSETNVCPKHSKKMEDDDGF
jgi:hypothetical protein